MEIQRNGVGLLAENWKFLQRFFKSPRNVGSVLPSSRYLARSMVTGLKFSPKSRVVEFGPGTGAFTREVARLLPEGGRFLGIERDPVFVDMLRQRFPRFSFACDSVENLLDVARERDFLPLDHIISGLPFAALPTSVTRPILDAAWRALRPGGTFTTFQYMQAYPIPRARKFRRDMGRLFGDLVTRRMVLRNVPPAFVLVWRKGN